MIYSDPGRVHLIKPMWHLQVSSHMQEWQFNSLQLKCVSHMEVEPIVQKWFGRVCSVNVLIIPIILLFH